MRYELNQIVRGQNAGTFVIIGFRTIGGEDYAQLKEVSPKDHTKVAPGEMALPLDAIRPIN